MRLGEKRFLIRSNNNYFLAYHSGLSSINLLNSEKKNNTLNDGEG